MARFDPHSYPDRLAFEANARRLRSDELGSIFAAAAASVRSLVQDFARRAAPGSGATTSHPPSATHAGSAS
jgi:hypothetical protein